VGGEVHDPRANSGVVTRGTTNVGPYSALNRRDVPGELDVLALVVADRDP
jgi:hypothetical protein